MSEDLEHMDGGRLSTDPEPWWAQARNVVWSLGPVTVAFLGLLAVVLGWLPSPMLSGIEAGTTILTRNQKIMSELQDDLRLHVKGVGDQQRDLLRALRQICRNTAKTTLQNDKCDDMN